MERASNRLVAVIRRPHVEQQVPGHAGVTENYSGLYIRRRVAHDIRCHRLSTGRTLGG